MVQEFHFRKTSWGIFISINIEEDDKILFSDIAVTEKIFIRVNWTDGTFKQEIVEWFSRAIKDVFEKISISQDICFDIKEIDFNDCHFQEEGLYYVMLGWLSEKYKFKLPPLDAYYDIEINKYIFPSLHRGLE